MIAVFKKQIDEMTEYELIEVFRMDYLRKLTRYKMTDENYKKKYGMDFDRFCMTNVVEKKNYTFEVESDSQEWELAIDGIKTVERKMKELGFTN